MSRFLGQYWFALIFGVVLALWIRHLVRQARRINAENPDASLLTKSQHAKLIVVIVIMTGAIVWLTAYGARINAETRALRCQRRYAAARSAADSATVDSLHPQQDSRITCKGLRTRP